MWLQSHSCYLISLVVIRVSHDIELHLWNWEVWGWFNIYNGLKVILCKNCQIEACQTAIPSGCPTEQLKVNQALLLSKPVELSNISCLLKQALERYTLPWSLSVPVSAPCSCWVGSKLRANLLFPLTGFCVAEDVLMLLWIIYVKCFLSMPL